MYFSLGFRYSMSSIGNDFSILTGYTNYFQKIIKTNPKTLESINGQSKNSRKFGLKDVPLMAQKNRTVAIIPPPDPREKIIPCSLKLPFSIPGRSAGGEYTLSNPMPGCSTDLKNGEINAAFSIYSQNSDSQANYFGLLVDLSQVNIKPLYQTVPEKNGVLKSINTDDLTKYSSINESMVLTFAYSFMKDGAFRLAYTSRINGEIISNGKQKETLFAYARSRRPALTIDQNGKVNISRLTHEKASNPTVIPGKTLAEAINNNKTNFNIYGVTDTGKLFVWLVGEGDIMKSPKDILRKIELQTGVTLREDRVVAYDAGTSTFVDYNGKRVMQGYDDKVKSKLPIVLEILPHDLRKKGGNVKQILP